MANLSVQGISDFKNEIEDFARQNKVTVLYGTVKLDEDNKSDKFIRVKCDSNFKWNDLLEKIGQSNNPYIVMDVYSFDADDFDSLPDKAEITKELLGENYETVKRKIKEFETILKETKVGDITTIIITANVGNYVVQQTNFSILSEVLFFDLEEYVEDEDNEEEQNIVKPPSKVEMKKMQETLKQSLLDDPMLLNCTNKSLRQSFLRDKIDEMDLHETVAYYLFRDSQHIVELAFAQLKKN